MILARQNDYEVVKNTIIESIKSFIDTKYHILQEY